MDECGTRAAEVAGLRPGDAEVMGELGIAWLERRSLSQQLQSGWVVVGSQGAESREMQGLGERGVLGQHAPAQAGRRPKIAATVGGGSLGHEPVDLSHLPWGTGSTHRLPFPLRMPRMAIVQRATWHA